MMNKGFSYGEAFGTGWAKFKEHWKFFVGAYLLVLVVTSVFSSLIEGPYKDIEPTSSLLSIIGSLIRMWLNFNLLVIAIRLFDGVKPEWGSLFIWQRETLSFIGASILYGLLIFAGLFIFVVPGLYFLVKYGLYGFVIADKKLSVMDALKMSGQLTDGAKWNLLGFGLASIGLMILGALALFVGILVAWPVITIAAVFVYRSLYTQTFELAVPVPSPVAPQMSAPIVAAPAVSQAPMETKMPEVVASPAPAIPAKPEPPVMMDR